MSFQTASDAGIAAWRSWRSMDHESNGKVERKIIPTTQCMILFIHPVQGRSECMVKTMQLAEGPTAKSRTSIISCTSPETLLIRLTHLIKIPAPKRLLPLTQGLADLTDGFTALPEPAPSAIAAAEWARWRYAERSCHHSLEPINHFSVDRRIRK